MTKNESVATKNEEKDSTDLEKKDEKKVYDFEQLVQEMEDVCNFHFDLSNVLKIRQIEKQIMEIDRIFKQDLKLKSKIVQFHKFEHHQMRKELRSNSHSSMSNSSDSSVSSSDIDVDRVINDIIKN